MPKGKAKESSMNSLVITGGQIDLPFAKKELEKQVWDMVISADSGLEFCREAQIVPDLILGDFDSVKTETLDGFQQNYPERIHRFPAMKDETDTELALLHAISAGATRITILGGTGTRLDHVLGNLQLLKLALDKGVDCVLLDSHNRIRLVADGLLLRKAEEFGDYVSLIPFTPQVCGLTLTGFAYEVRDFTLQAGQARGVSNQICEEVAQICLTEGLLLVIESRD